MPSTSNSARIVGVIVVLGLELANDATEDVAMRLHVLFLAIALTACKSTPPAKTAAPANTDSSATAPAAEPGSDTGDQCCCVDPKNQDAGTLYVGAKAAARCQREQGTCVAEFGDIDACMEAANLGTGVPAGD
jgi:hypothetical protein